MSDSIQQRKTEKFVKSIERDERRGKPHSIFAFNAIELLDPDFDETEIVGATVFNHHRAVQ